MSFLAAISRTTTTTNHNHQDDDGDDSSTTQQQQQRQDSTSTLFLSSRTTSEVIITASDSPVSSNKKSQTQQSKSNNNNKKQVEITNQNNDQENEDAFYELEVYAIHNTDHLTILDRNRNAYFDINLGGFIQLPKLAKPSNAGPCDPFAWEARDVLRKNFLGRPVVLTELFSIPAASSTLASPGAGSTATTTTNAPATGAMMKFYNVTRYDGETAIMCLVKRGLAECKTDFISQNKSSVQTGKEAAGGAKKRYNFSHRVTQEDLQLEQALEKAQDEAQRSRIGIWSMEVEGGNKRQGLETVVQTIPFPPREDSLAAELIASTIVGRWVKISVEKCVSCHIHDGILLNSFQEIRFKIAGLLAPETSAVFKEGRMRVSRKMLHRVVEVFVAQFDRSCGMFIVRFRDERAERLVREGLALIDRRTLHFTRNSDMMLQEMAFAMRNRNGIFAEQYGTNSNLNGTDYAHIFSPEIHEFVGHVVAVPGEATVVVKPIKYYLRQNPLQTTSTNNSNNAATRSPPMSSQPSPNYPAKNIKNNNSKINNNTAEPAIGMTATESSSMFLQNSGMGAATASSTTFMMMGRELSTDNCHWLQDPQQLNAEANSQNHHLPPSNNPNSLSQSSRTELQLVYEEANKKLEKLLEMAASKHLPKFVEVHVAFIHPDTGLSQRDPDKIGDGFDPAGDAFPHSSFNCWVNSGSELSLATNQSAIEARQFLRESLLDQIVLVKPVITALSTDFPVTSESESSSYPTSAAVFSNLDGAHPLVAELMVLLKTQQCQPQQESDLLLQLPQTITSHHQQHQNQPEGGAGAAVDEDNATPQKPSKQESQTKSKVTTSSIISYAFHDVATLMAQFDVLPFPQLFPVSIPGSSNLVLPANSLQLKLLNSIPCFSINPPNSLVEIVFNNSPRIKLYRTGKEILNNNNNNSQQKNNNNKQRKTQTNSSNQSSANAQQQRELQAVDHFEKIVYMTKVPADASRAKLERMFYPDKKLSKRTIYTAFIDDCANDLSSFEISLTSQTSSSTPSQCLTIHAHLACVEPFAGNAKAMLRSFKERILTKRTFQVQLVDVAPALINSKTTHQNFEFTILLRLFDDNNNNNNDEDSDESQKSVPPFISLNDYTTTRKILKMIRTTRGNFINACLLRFGLGFFWLCTDAATAHMIGNRGLSYQLMIAEMLRYYLCAIKAKDCGIWSLKGGIRKEFEKDPLKFLKGGQNSINNKHHHQSNVGEVGRQEGLTKKLATLNKSREYELVYNTSSPFHGRVFFVSHQDAKISLTLPDQYVQAVTDALAHGHFHPFDSFSSQHLYIGQPIVVYLGNHPDVTQDIVSRCALRNSRLQRAVVAGIEVESSSKKKNNNNDDDDDNNNNNNIHPKSRILVSLVDAVDKPLLWFDSVNDVFEIETIVIDDSANYTEEQRTQVRYSHQRMQALMMQNVPSLVRNCKLAYFDLEKDNEAQEELNEYFAAGEQEDSTQQKYQARWFPPSRVFADELYGMIAGVEMQFLPFYAVRKNPHLVQKPIEILVPVKNENTKNNNNNNNSNKKRNQNKKQQQQSKPAEGVEEQQFEKKVEMREHIEYESDIYVLISPLGFVENDDDEAQKLNQHPSGFDYQEALQLQKKLRLKFIAQFDVEAIELAPTFLAEAIV